VEKEAQTSIMHYQGFGEGKRLANKVGQTLSERIIPTFHMRCIILFFLDSTKTGEVQSLMAKLCQALQAARHSFIPPSLQEIAEIFARLQQETGYTVRPYERRALGITPLLGSWLRKAGFQPISNMPYAIEVSAGMQAHPHFVQLALAFSHQIKPFLLRTGVMSEPAFEELIQQMEGELQAPTFCGICFLLRVSGQKL
jgi:hypothetical protein